MVFRWLLSALKFDSESVLRPELDAIMDELGEGWTVDWFEIGYNGAPWAAMIRYGNVTVRIANFRGFLEAENQIDGKHCEPIEWPTRLKNLRHVIWEVENCCEIIRYLAEHHPNADPKPQD